MNQRRLIRDVFGETASSILGNENNAWNKEAIRAESLPKAQEDTLTALLGFISKFYPASFDAVKRRLENPDEFPGVLSELVLLYALHQANSSPSMEIVRYSVEYNAGTGSPDFKVIRPDLPVVGIEVTKAQVQNEIDHYNLSKEQSLQSVDARIAEPMKKLDAKMEEKVGKFGDCSIKVIALDISDYVSRVFLSSDIQSIRYHMETYLYGQATIGLQLDEEGKVRDAQAYRNSGELPTVKGDGVEVFFRCRPEIAAVVYFWHQFQNMGSWHGFKYWIFSRLQLNPATPENNRLPYDLAFALVDTLNACGPFTVDTLRHYSSGWVEEG